MIKAVFIDFYGTLVHEDGAVIKQVSQIIFETGVVQNYSDIGGYWWSEFQTMFHNAYGESFVTQRELEYRSLKKTIEHFNSTADVVELSEMMFRHWTAPPAFPEAKAFFEACPFPVYIVSNIDTSDINKAIEFHGFKPDGVFTSEDAKSYKPRSELFEYALSKTGFASDEVIHIGDSLSSDINGAGNVGIKPVWINRDGKTVPDGVIAVNDLLDVFRTSFFGRNKNGII